MHTEKIINAFTTDEKHPKQIKKNILIQVPEKA